MIEEHCKHLYSGQTHLAFKHKDISCIDINYNNNNGQHEALRVHQPQRIDSQQDNF